jgi:two-component system chemotaxis response regulator CheY
MNWAGAAMRALIVDDSRFARKHVRALLERQRIECEEAVDGVSGLECLRTGGEFDVVLIDWFMPAMGGLEMVKALRSEGFNQVKVMMVTSDGESGVIVSALEAGADEYLMKPFDAEALNDKLALMGLEAA